MTGQRVSLKIVAVVLLVALVAMPAVAGRTIKSGDTIYTGEEGLNFIGFGALGINQTSGMLVHYADPTAGLVDKTIFIYNVANFELIPADVGTAIGFYYIFPSGFPDLHPANATGYVNIKKPEVELDVVLSNSRSDSISGKSIARNDSLEFKLANNLVGLPGATMNIEVTLPDDRVTTQFGGQTLSNIPVNGYTVYKGAIDLTDAPPGTYTAVAKWPSTSDFYGKGFDSNVVTFEVVALIAGSLNVWSTPSGASIYIDGTYKGATPLVVSGLSEGSRQVRLTKSGYSDHTQTAIIAAGKTTNLSANLFPVPTPSPSAGSLDVRSTPTGANIYIDGTYKGATPLVVSGLSEGSHQVRLSKSGYNDHTETAFITAGKTDTISITLLPPTPLPTTPPTSPRGGTSSGSLDISSTPTGASVYIDGTYKGGTPLVVSGLSEGSHRVRLSKSGYNDHTQTVFITAGKTTIVSANIPPIPQITMPQVIASLDVRSTPTGASVYIDGTYKGVTPLMISGLSEGSHQVKLSKSGYSDHTQTVFATAGKTTIVSPTLISNRPSTGALNVKSTPSGANVYIGGTYKGITPLVVSELSEGSHQVRLARGGYYDHTQTVSITAGYTATVSPTLSPRSPDPPKQSPATTFFWLIAAAIVLSVGGFIYTRKKRGAQTAGPKADATHSSNASAGYGTGHVPPPDAITPRGKAGVSDQKGSNLTPGNSVTDVVLPDGGSAASTAKPEISITLSHTSIHADEWDKIGLTLVNAGTTHAFDITLTFSGDFDTGPIQPVNLAPGTSTIIEAGIKPRAKGKVPLEIIVRYRDAEDQTYKQTTSFWLQVEPQSDSLPPDSPIPSSIPRPMTPKSLPQEMADRYTASEFIGKGGFARVFKVQKSDGSWVALKIPISLDAATGRSFITELQNWTTLVHENIVRVNDYNIMPFPYFELELCDGTLAELEKPVPPEHAAWLIFSICEGLKYAHARGILHRDLKPQNIMLRDGVPKISDWGLSKVMMQSGTTTTSGGFTAYYAAPEQITNKPKDERTDIWQIGVILYELVTGRLPFTGESMVEIGMAIATKTPERPGAVHPDAELLDGIIQKCLEKDPDQRYRSVIDLQKDLTAYLKMNYIESLKESIQTKNFQRSAYYCGDLVLISMKIGDLMAAYKYANDLVSYSTGEARKQAIELARQIKARVEMGAQELPGELVRKAEVVVHQIRMQG